MHRRRIGLKTLLTLAGGMTIGRVLLYLHNVGSLNCQSSNVHVFVVFLWLQQFCQMLEAWSIGNANASDFQRIVERFECVQQDAS